MIRINYITRKGAHVQRTVATLAEAADVLHNLWQARIEAEAYCGDIEVGAVWKLDGSLTWYCEIGD